MRKKFRIFAHINEEEKTVTMTKVNKVLFITQEIAPYLPDSEMSLTGRNLPSAIQERGREIRTFMPKWGNINERRNQLHEVIRLSGMNLIIDDTDHPLIIKVASIQSTRMQVYFIDNDDYFMNRLEATDENGNEVEYYVKREFHEDDFIIVEDLDNTENFQNAIKEGVYYFAKYIENESTNEMELKTLEWSTLGGGAISEILDTSDDAAAQAEYEAVQDEVQTMDKKLEMRINELETEREAIQTEMDSVKKIIEDNIEGSFTALS